MQGKLKGTRLEAIPSDMTTWRAWHAAHPATTVLNLPRTHRAYTRSFYRQPAAYVLGWVAAGRAYHCSFDVLLKHRVVHCRCGDSPLLVTFDEASTAARLFSRRVGDDVLDFVLMEEGRMRDARTGSIWDFRTGEAVSGSLNGERLKHQVGIVSLARAWQAFHPESEEKR